MHHPSQLRGWLGVSSPFDDKRFYEIHCRAICMSKLIYILHCCGGGPYPRTVLRECGYAFPYSSAVLISVCYASDSDADTQKCESSVSICT